MFMPIKKSMNKDNQKKPFVSIVIPCYNAKDFIKGCLKSVLKTTYPNFELILVDDFSKDGTDEYLLKTYKNNRKISIVRNKKNSGPSVTRNHGVLLARGELIAFVETDMEVDPGWLEPLVEAMQNDEKLGAVQSKILDINKRNLIQSMGVKFNPHTFWVISPDSGKNKKSIPQTLEMGIGSVGSLVRRSVIKKIGCYDEKLVHNIDDLDFGWRIWLAGYNIRTIPESITYHWTAKPSSLREKTTPSLASELHFHKGPRILIKNYEVQNVIRYLPWLFFAYFIRIIKNLFAGNTTPLRGFLKSLVWEVSSFPDTLKERKRIQKLRKRTDKEMFEKLAIPGNFFHFYFSYVK